ncbi:unnamed protein product [Rotaria socialis]|uniref:Ankyrin n=1 Tax=Rotaria socialis TaxID=392032 RepID=A0A817ZYN1_9BILA|nr:unnamed protein product [Rotaria socialis]
MSIQSATESRVVSITRPSSIKLPPMSAVNYPIYNHQSDGNSGFLRAARAGNLEKVLEYLRSSIDINTSNANGLNALHLASKEGHVNIVQELLSRGANVNAATKKGNTALHIASLAGQEEVVKLLVQYNANINCQSQNGFSPLYMAAQENHIEVVKFLLANGANQSLATEDGFTPLAVSLQQGHEKVVAILLENDSKGSKVRLPALHIAAKKNDTKAAALLLQGESQPDLNYKEGGFVNCTTKSGFTPLHIAAHYGNLEVAQLLIARGADVNYAASQNITPLHVASKWGKDNIVKLLLEKSAQIDAKTKDGLTPLHCAARSGHDQVVDLLLESGAPFGAKTKNGLSALHMAAQGDHVDAARILLYYKSTLVDDVSSDYLSALHVASHCGNFNVAKLLCERRADVNAKALNGFSCLHIACKKNRLKLVELLIANDADVEARTESGLTSLHVASFVGSHEIVIYLLQHGANIDSNTVRGETPLHLAARNNQIDIVQTLLNYGATVDAKAKEAQTCLHLATRLGNIEIVSLLLKANAFVDSETKDGYSSLHIAAKEGHEEIASLLIDHGANLNLFTKRNFSALHICSKYGNIKVANLLLQKGASPDIQGKNDLTPLHCAVHYNHSNIALLLLQHGASPHVTARNGYTPLHIAAKKNVLDIAEMLLEYNANTNAQSTGGFTPLHLSCQDGHSDMTYLLLANHADPNIASKCHLTPLHLCAQEDRVKCAEALVSKQADINAQTLSGYTSLHVACHFGQINMVRYLLKLGANVNIETNLMFTPLHSAAQQGHVMIVKLLLENGASPNKTNKHGMTALSIAQRLGYISVVEELKVVTETTIASKHELITEERYKIQAPEVSHEEHPLTDSEDETAHSAEDNIAVIYPEIGYLELAKPINNLKIRDKTNMLGDASSNVHMQYLREGVLMTEAEENKLNQTSFIKEETEYPMLAAKDHWTESRDNLHDQPTPIVAPQTFVADNETITKPRHGGFLVSFLVDARGGAMRGCRHSGVRVIIPSKRASMPTRITCRFVKREKLTIPPPLNEGEALAARVLEVGPVACKFLGPVILEIPHFASLRHREREIVVLRSDNGEKWTEHTGPTTDEAVREVLGDVVDSEDLDNAEELQSRRITRIVTNDFPRFFALITRLRQEASLIDEQGGLLTSTIMPTIQAHIPEKALQKRIRISLHVLPISPQLVQRSFGSRVHVSPVITVEPRRRKFHKPITLTIPLPNKTSSSRKHSQQQQHSNAYTSDSQTLRLLCSITGGTHAAQFDDITGHTPLTFSKDTATFTTTVSARFWLIDAQGVPDVLKLAHEIYREAILVPYMSRFIVFAKRHDQNEALVRLFCITDDKENKTLEMQEHFTEIAKSKEVEVVNGNSIYIDLQSNNLQTIIKTNEQLTLLFRAFKENRLPCVVRIRDQEQDPSGRLIFSKDNGKLTSIQRTTSLTMTNGQPSSLSSTTVVDPQALQAICNLNIVIPAYDKDLLENEERLRALHSVDRDHNSENWKSDDMYRKGEIRLTDIARLLGSDWPALAAELELSEDEVTKIMDDFGENASLQMLRYWLKSRGSDATGNCLQQALRKIGKENIVHNCVFNIEWVTDAAEKELARARLNSRGGSVDGAAISGRRLDEGFESDDEFERRRHGKSNLLNDETNRIPTTTIIKTITLEEIAEDELGGKKAKTDANVSQFKQLEPRKMVKRDCSKDCIPSSSSTSSADTIVTVAMRENLGERDGPLHFVDSSKAPTPASRYGGYYSIYNTQDYSGSITPLSYQAHPFEMMHLESLREKLNRLSYDKADLDDPYSVLQKQRITDMDEGRMTPKASLEFQSKRSSSKLGDFGIVNIVQEATPIASDLEYIQSDLNDQTPAVEQLAEQTAHAFDDIPPIRANQTPVTDRLIKSSLIPEPARALAHALKHAVVRPLKRTMIKKKSLDGNLTEQQTNNAHQPTVYLFSNPSAILVENTDQQLLNEISIDSSFESASPIPLAVSPAKPPRLAGDESGSSSSVDISSPPPVKPPRHFSLYKNDSNQNLLQEANDAVRKVLSLFDTFNELHQNDDDIIALRRASTTSQTANRQISDSLKHAESFSVQPISIAIKTDIPLSIKSLENHTEKPMAITSFSSSTGQTNGSSLEQSSDENIPIEIIQLANDLAENILATIQQQAAESTKTMNDEKVLFDKLTQLETSCDSTSTLSHSLITSHILPTQTTTCPLVSVSSTAASNTTKKVSPLIDIVTRTATPTFTTSVTITSSSKHTLASVKTTHSTDDEFDNTLASISNSNQTSNTSNLLQTNSKQDSFDSNDLATYDNTIFLSQNTGNVTPTRSLISDYDNLHGSYGSLNDDNQEMSVLPFTLPALPSSLETTSSIASSSMTTIYESFDNFPSMSSSATSPTYVSAASTFNTGGTTTPRCLDTDDSDEELAEPYNIENSNEASTPVIEIIEDNSEPIDECDMTFLTEVLAQYNQNLHHQDNFETTNIQSIDDKQATLTSKVEELPLSSLSSRSEPLSLLISVSSNSASSSFSSFPSFHIATLASSKFSPDMPHKTSNVKFQKEKKDSDIDLQSQNRHRRLPLPKKLSFEQNITNLLETESPLLHSELLTTEHELSVFRSRLAVNEGVTAITGTILESLKDQFGSNHKIDDATSSVDRHKPDILQRSSSMQTSPTNERLPDSIELHYDAVSPRSPYILVKAKNSYWVAQPINNSEVEKHLKTFSSPIMKRASIKLPDTFYIDDDNDNNSDDEEISTKRLNDAARLSLTQKPLTNIDEDNKSKDSISEENESLTIDPHEQLAEMKKIRTSLLLRNKDQFDNFDDKIDEIYLIIDYLKHNKLTSTILNNLRLKFNELKLLIRNIHASKQDDLRIEYELDKLENAFKKTSNHDDYHFIELFEQNLRGLQYIIQQIRIARPSPSESIVEHFESIKNDSNKQIITSKPTYTRLIPESPVVTSDIFFEGNKVSKEKKSPTSIQTRLIPEDARVSAESFYEGDIHRSLYQTTEQDKQMDNFSKKKPLIPENAQISSANFYEGDAQRSMFIERSSTSHNESLSQPVTIENLRAIMSDLMLVASWSKKPAKLKTQQTKDDVEVHAESFITTEQRHPILPYCEITHDIENFTLRHPSILIDEQDAVSPENIEFPQEQIIKSSQMTQQEAKVNDVTFIDNQPQQMPTETESQVISSPQSQQDDDEYEHQFAAEPNNSSSRMESNIFASPSLSPEQVEHGSLSFEQDINDENFHDYPSYPYYNHAYIIPCEDSSAITHIKCSSIISKTISSYMDDDFDEEYIEESPFRPTHLDILSDTNQMNILSEDNIQYDKLLIEASNNLVEKILNNAILEIVTYEQDYSLYQVASQIVNDVILNIFQNCDDEFNLAEPASSRSSTSGDNEIEEKEYDDEYLSSDVDDEENQKLIPQMSDQPYLFVTDVITSKSTQELGSLIQELQSLEYQIHDNRPISSSSSSSSSSLFDNDEYQAFELSVPKIITTRSVNELTNLVSELENIEDQLEERLDSPKNLNQPPVSSKSFNELGGLIHELQNVSKQLNNRIHEEIFTSTNIESLSQDLVKFRRDSLSSGIIQSPNRKEQQPSAHSAILEQELEFKTSTNDIDRLQYEDYENHLAQTLVDDIIKEAHYIMLAESSSNVFPTVVKSIPTIIVGQHPKPNHQLSVTSISDDLEISHEDPTTDRTLELAAQLDYLRRMSRYDDQQEQIEKYSFENCKSIEKEQLLIHTNYNGDDECKLTNYSTVSHEGHSSSDENNLDKTLTKSEYQQQINIIHDSMIISEDSINQQSTDSLDYHSTETELNQLYTRRTTSDNSLYSTSSIHTCDNHSLSASCLVDGNDLTTPTKDDDDDDDDNEQNSLMKATGARPFDRVKSFVSKSVDMVQETIDNRHKQRTTDSDKNDNLRLNINEKEFSSPQQHFQSAYDLHDEEKSKLIRSPEVYNMKYAVKHDHSSLLTSSQIQHRTLSESSLTVEDSKRKNLVPASTETSSEFLTTISKDNSLELLQNPRYSTPFDDVIEKESSPEHSESYNIPISAFSDVLEPTSSCQRPLTFCVTELQHIKTEAEIYRVATDLVDQVLYDVVVELTGEQDESNSSKESDKLSISSSSSSLSDDDDDDLLEEEEEQQPQEPIKYRRLSSKMFRRTQTDATYFELIESSTSQILPIIRRNSQSDTDTYYRATTTTTTTTTTTSINKPYNKSRSDEKLPHKNSAAFVQQNEKYSGAGEENSGGKQRVTQRRKRPNDIPNVSESPAVKNLSFKCEFNEALNRRESLDSPSADLNDKSIRKSLQEGILRTNLKSWQTDLELIHQQEDPHFHEHIYSSTTKKSTSYYAYDAESEPDRDDLKATATHSDIILSKVQKDSNYNTTQNLTSDNCPTINLPQIYWPSASSSESYTISPSNDIKNLLDDLIESIPDDLPTSISSEPLSSQSDATTVIFNSNKNSMDDGDNTGQCSHISSQDLTDHDKRDLSGIISSSPSSSSQTHSVIHYQHDRLSQTESNLNSFVNKSPQKESSTSTFSDAELIGHNTKTKFYSYPGSLGGAHMPPSSIESIPNDYYSKSTASTTFQSSN